MTVQPGAVRLEVLGGVALHAGGSEARAVLAQPKRLAVLVWMTLHRAGGWVRRDELLAAFWPDTPPERARVSLRQAVQYLRRHLGDDVVRRRGDVELGVDPVRLRCDALEFLAAIARGDDVGAIGSYSGELLAGFTLHDADAFDRWLHAERQRLRSMAAQSALRAATRAAEAGDDAAAASHVEWALQLEPRDEAVARRLMQIHLRNGNRTAALATYEALAARLREELDVEPSPQTVALITAARAPASDASDAGIVDVPHGSRALSSQRVLVVALENRTGDARYDVLCGLAAETVARGLADVPDLEVIPPLAVGPVPASHTKAGASILPPALGELALRTGAGTLVDGYAQRIGSGVWLHARAIDVAGDRLRPGPEPVQVDDAAPLDAIERLREQVVTALAPALTRRVLHLGPATRPPGIDAYRAYVEGMERFVAGEWIRALEHFAHCRTLAPGYALPRIVSAIAYWNLGQLHDARAVAREADALRTTLGRFERAVLDTVLAWLAGDWAAAHRAVAVQAEMAPGSIPHCQVAEELRRLNYPRRARDVLLRLDPEAGELRGWIFYWNELVTSYHMLRDHDRELQAAARCRELHPHVPLAALLEARALAALGRADDATRVVEQVLASPAGHTRAAPELLIDAALELRAHGSPDAAAALLERAVEWCRARTNGSSDTRRALGRALYHAGVLDEAHDIFEQLARTTAGRVQPVGLHHMQLGAHLDEGYLAAIAARRSDKPVLQRWCTHLRQLDAPFLYGAQWYWLAVVAAINNDRDDVVRMLGRAFADGMAMESFVHTDPHLEGLRDEPRVAALLRPRD